MVKTQPAQRGGEVSGGMCEGGVPLGDRPVGDLVWLTGQEETCQLHRVDLNPPLEVRLPPTLLNSASPPTRARALGSVCSYSRHGVQLRSAACAVFGGCGMGT